MECAEYTPSRRRFPFTAFLRSCFDGEAWTKSPSVTGRNANDPKSPDSDTVALAFCSRAVSALTKQSKVVDLVRFE